MNLGKSFSYVFEDDNWILPILVGGLILLIPILGLFWLLGYAIECARREYEQNPDRLPGLEQFGTRLADGFKTFIISFIYALPAVIIGVLFGLLLALPLSAIEGGNGGGELVAFPVILFTLCFIPIMIILGLFLQVLTFAAWGIYLRTDSVSAALRFGEAYRYVSGNAGKYLMVWLVQILASFIGSLGGIFFGFGALFTTVYGMAMFGNYFGQLVTAQEPYHAAVVE